MQDTGRMLESLRDVGRCSLAGAAAGALGGVSLATYRGHTASFYGVMMSLNCLMITGSIVGSERVISYFRGKSDCLTYGGAGVLGGGLLSAIHAGGVRSQGVPAGALLFGVFSSGGRFTYDLVASSKL